MPFDWRRRSPRASPPMPACGATSTTSAIAADGWPARASEKQAFALLRERVRAASPANAGRSIPVPYGGWQAQKRDACGWPTARWPPVIRWCAPSPRPKDGLTAEVIDLGRGTPEEFAAHAGEIKGRIVLVRHELMFAAGTIHRRRKYDMARANGAVGFLIGGPLPRPRRGGLVGPRERRRHSGARHRARDGGAAGAPGRRAGPTVTMTIETDGGAGRDRDAGLRLSRHDRRMGGAVGPCRRPRPRRSRRWTTAPGSPRCWR